MQPTEEARQIHPRVIASNDVEVVVVVHYHQRGVDSVGRTCDTEVIGVYRVEGEKVTRLQMFYFDPDHVARFLTAAAGEVTP